MMPREVIVLFILCTSCSLGVAGVACVVVVNGGESADVIKLLVFCEGSRDYVRAERGRVMVNCAVMTFH